MPFILLQVQILHFHFSSASPARAGMPSSWFSSFCSVSSVSLPPPSSSVSSFDSLLLFLCILTSRAALFGSCELSPDGRLWGLRLSRCATLVSGDDRVDSTEWFDAASNASFELFCSTLSLFSSSLCLLNLRAVCLLAACPARTSGLERFCPRERSDWARCPTPPFVDGLCP